MIVIFGNGERFEEIKQELSDEFGDEPTNPAAVGIIMAQYAMEDSELSGYLLRQ